MYLIAGLGNPGRDYAGTRHNVGFEVVKKLACDHNIELNKTKHRAIVSEGIICAQKAILSMPMTYMNLSGESVRDLMNFYKLASDRLIVVFDDVSLGVGEVRVRESGGAGGHNGMKNIIYQLETDEFTRVRVGIGAKPPGWDLANYVLSKFKKDEIDDIVGGITKAGDAVEIILREGTQSAMNRFNQKTKGGAAVDPGNE